MATLITRRTILSSAAAAGVLTAAGMSAAEASKPRPPHRPGAPVRLTIMGTTDLHGCVFNWDYFKNAEYTDSATNDIGLAKVATLVEAVRAQRGRAHTLMIDAGDTIQGTPLAYYFARVAPITRRKIHPMAAAMNHIGYDAAALGNHEFNYGIPLLRTFADQLDFPLPYPENAATLVAQQVPGIDAILVGHGHQEITERRVVNEKTGREVVLTEPLRWGMRLSLIDLSLVKIRGRWVVQKVGSTLLNSNTVAEDPHVKKLLTRDHDKVVSYVNAVVGRCTQAMSCATARYQDTAALDFINLVQAEAVRTAIAGTAAAALPMLSIAAPFYKDANIPAGDVSVRDVAGLYIYDNTLLGIVFTGEQVKAYLEKSAVYFKEVTGTGPFKPDDLTNAVTVVAPGGTPDYNYDVMGGLDAPLTYDIDVSQAPGSRILKLRYAGKDVDPKAQFVVAINNYRQSGGGGFPGVTTAPVVHNAQQEIRQLIIDWVTSHGTIDPPAFASMDWQLVSGGLPVKIIP